MRARFVLLLVASCSGAAVATDANAPQLIDMAPGFHYAVPKASPVKFDKKQKDDHTAATFSGQFRVEGEYRYGRLSNDPKDEAAYDMIELVFVPDPAFRADLPYWYERGPVEELSIENAEDFAAAVIGPSLVQEVKRRRRMSVSGRAAIVVDRYTASVVCDTPTYTVHFLKVDKPPTVVARNYLIQSGCL